VRLFTDTYSAADKKTKSKLTRLRYKLFLVWALRYPASLVEGTLRKRSKSVRDYILLILGLPLYVFTKPGDLYLKGKALDEWQNRKTERNGSEMFLFYKPDQNTTDRRGVHETTVLRSAEDESSASEPGRLHESQEGQPADEADGPRGRFKGQIL
jgi:hypothetical protein